MAASALTELRRELDHDGCAYGQVSRERAAHLMEAVTAVERKLNYVLAAIGLQLLSFVLSVLLYLVAHSR